MRKNLIDASVAENMTSAEVWAAVFDGAKPGEYRGLTDAFTFAAIDRLALHHDQRIADLACDILDGEDTRFDAQVRA